MKTLVSIFAVVFALGVAHAGPEQIIKQRAKDLRDQNNAQQGVTPAQPRIATTPAAPKIASTPPQPALAQLHSELLNLKTNAPVTAAQIQQFARSLAAAAQAVNKPSEKTLQKLSKDLLTALAEKPLNSNLRSRLLQNLMAVLNGPNLTTTQVKNIVSDIQGVLQMSGTPAEKAAVIGDDVRSISVEVRKA